MPETADRSERSGSATAPTTSPMLRAVDVPVLVRRPDGRHVDGLHLPGLIIASYAGPEGWREAVLGLLRGPPDPRTAGIEIHLKGGRDG